MRNGCGKIVGTESRARRGRAFGGLVLAMVLASGAGIAAAAQFTCVVPATATEPKHEVQVEAAALGAAFCSVVQTRTTCPPAQLASSNFGSSNCWDTAVGPTALQSANRPTASTATSGMTREQQGIYNVRRPMALAQTGSCAATANACMAACGSPTSADRAVAVAQCRQPCQVARTQCGLKAAEAERTGQAPR